MLGLSSPHPTPPRPSPMPPLAAPGVIFGYSELLGQFSESAWFTELAELAEEFRMPFRYLFAPISIRSVSKISRLSEQSLHIVWTQLDSVNSVDIPYRDMSELSKLYTCQVYKYWNVELQNVNILKYPRPLDGIIICITLVTLLFLYVFLPFVHLFLL